MEYSFVFVVCVKNIDSLKDFLMMTDAIRICGICSELLKISA